MHWLPTWRDNEKNAARASRPFNCNLRPAADSFRPNEVLLLYVAFSTVTEFIFASPT